MLPDNIRCLAHPLVQHHVAILRDQATDASQFRDAVRRLSTVLCVEATRDLSVTRRTVQTPLSDCEGQQLSQSIAIVPILRAGLGMVDPLLDLIPQAAVWHLGLYRSEETAQPVGYYDKLESGSVPDLAFVVDPMLATGGSIDLTVRRLQDWGVRDIRVIALIASQAGVDRVAEDFADVSFTIAAIDPELNDQAYIVPGLGDAGDRIFNTQ
ncbi:Uracil phosphoribosyltransferase [Stieleria bergensis]|uniref:Uracil phosphoribosyltransferase n=1 Tax=Stieleria bergensis TaxID=2528025 RepID=A0A517SV73_9BACT|nr:Uracil phosphoribosyltransferase [Planctomycetes bacterium SV_7m_r]